MLINASLFFGVVQLLMLVVMVMISVAFFSLLERKILGLMHFRKGPNKIMLSGFFQPFSDAIKLITKDDSPVLWSNFLPYYFSPLFMLFLSLVAWWVFPFYWSNFSSSLSLVMVMLILGSTIYGILISGWASNSKYATLGSMRSISQSISYEMLIGLGILSYIFIYSSPSLGSLYEWDYLEMILIMSPITLIILISSVAELNRSPFDLSEGESELVSGYSVEYGGVMYTLIFLSENMMIFFSSFLVSFLNFIQSPVFVSFMMIMVIFLFCIIRGIVPRLRYDNLIEMCWIFLLPPMIILFNLIYLMGLII